MARKSAPNIDPVDVYLSQEDIFKLEKARLESNMASLQVKLAKTELYAKQLEVDLAHVALEKFHKNEAECKTSNKAVLDSIRSRYNIPNDKKFGYDPESFKLITEN